MNKTDKEIFNNLLSRLDTLHDFCDPTALRNKDKTPNINKSDEFLNIFKPFILKGLKSEKKIASISHDTLMKDVKKILNTYFIEEKKKLIPFYVNDLENLLDRTKNGSILLDNFRTIDKELYDKIKPRIGRFEPSVVAFFEFLYNIVFPNDNIGNFISNKYLPVFDYVNKEYKVLDKVSEQLSNQISGKVSDQIFKINKYDNQNKEYTDSTNVNIKNYIEQNIKNKENIITFVLGTINDEDSGDILIDGKNTSGFYNFNKIIYSNKKEKTLSRKEADKNIAILQETYFRYLNDIRYILGLYYILDSEVIIYLIVDTTGISFSKYYEVLSEKQKIALKIKVLCNVAMSWDGATSPKCQKKENNKNHLYIVDKVSNLETRSIFDIESIELTDTIGVKKNDTSVILDTGNIAFNLVPREVGEISECIRQNINPKRKKIIPNQCTFKTIGKLVDIKRTGDALQALMAQKLNLEQDANSFYIFVTLDHLAFLKARINNIPTLYTQTHTDSKTDDTNRVIVLFNNKFSTSYKSIALQLEQEVLQFELISNNIKECYPLSEQNNFNEKAYFNFFLILDYLYRIIFGIVLFNRPNEDFTNNISDLSDEITTSSTYLNILMNEFDEFIPSNLKKINKYHNKYQKECFISIINDKINNLQIFINNLNNKIIEIKKEIILIAAKNNIDIEKDLNNDFSIDLQKSIDDIKKYILNSFIIESFYTIKRSGIFKQYFDDNNTIKDTLSSSTKIIADIKVYSETKENSEKEKILKNNFKENSEKIEIDNITKNAMENINSLKFINKKYENFTITKNKDEALRIIKMFFVDTNYNPDFNQSKIDINILFNFNIKKYDDFFIKLEKTIQNIFENDILKRIKIWLDKFKQPNYFIPPPRPSRTSLSIKDKINECIYFFQTQININMCATLYRPIFIICEDFYKDTMAELQISNISSKPIIFDIAVTKLLNDFKIKKQKGGIEMNNIEMGNVEMGNVETDNAETDNDKIEIDNDKIEILSLFTLLDLDIIYDNEYQCNFIFNDNDLTNRKIYNNYRLFLRDIYINSNNDKYIPKALNINNIYIETLKNLEWIIDDNSLDFNFLVSNLLSRILLLKDNNITKNILSNINIDDLIIEQELRPYIYIVVSELLSQIVINLFTIIEDFYKEQSIFNMYVKLDQNPIYDLILWIMLNDPTMLLYHPKRKTEWSEIENKIIDILDTPELNLIYKNNDVLQGGEPSTYTSTHTQQDIKEKRRRKRINLVNLKLEQIQKPEIKHWKQKMGQEQEQGQGQEQEQEQEQKQKQEQEQYVQNQRINNDLNMINYRKQQQIEYNTQINKKQKQFDSIQSDSIQSDSIQSESIQYTEYMTLDEYMYMKIIFKNDDFLLKTNIGIISSINMMTGEFKNINIYNLNQQINPFIQQQTEQFVQQMDQSGGNINNNIIYKNLMDYHNKYYKTYYNIYYKK